MMGLFTAIFLFSIIVAVVCRFVFPQRFNNFETMLIGVGSVILGLILMLIISWTSTTDFDILNGQITGKKMHRVSCEHSYQCMCVTVSTGKNSSTTICQTCYEHPFDQDWDVYSSVGNFAIEREDSQGLVEPKRWDQVKIGEPASKKEYVTNYILASPDSLFHTKSFQDDNVKYGKWLPSYNTVYDYYRYHHVYNMVPSLKESKQYNDAIGNILKSLGAKKQVNIDMVFVPTDDRNYKNALARHWLGGKKNDVVVVIGITQYPKIAFADAFTFANSTHNEMLVVKLQQDIEAVGDVSKVNDVVNVINDDTTKYFHRDNMSNYKYLKDDFVPSGKALFWSGLFYFLILIGALIFFWINDVEIDGVSTNRFKNYY